MNLLIARSNKFSYSETFIDNQINSLKPKIVVYEGWYPSILANGQSFLPFPFNFLIFRGSFRNVFPKIYHKIYSLFFSNYLLKNGIDVVLANYGPMGVSLIEACKKSKVKIYVHFHGFDATEYKILEKYKIGYEKMFMLADGIIVVSTDMKKQLMSLGAKEEKIFLNPYGVDTSIFYNSKSVKKEQIFVAVGRFTAKKAPLNTINAFSIVLQKVKNAKLIMIGDGELFENAIQLVSQLGIQSNVEFLGKKSPFEIAEILKESQVFVQHSICATNGDSEGTPNSILEASSSGLPIVSTMHAGIKDAVIHGETGFLVEEGDWEKMAEYMIELAQNPELAAQMGRRGREFMIKNYDKERQVQKLREILNN